MQKRLIAHSQLKFIKVIIQSAFVVGIIDQKLAIIRPIMISAIDVLRMSMVKVKSGYLLNEKLSKNSQC